MGSDYFGFVLLGFIFGRMGRKREVFFVWLFFSRYSYYLRDNLIEIFSRTFLFISCFFCRVYFCFLFVLIFV